MRPILPRRPLPAFLLPLLCALWVAACGGESPEGQAFPEGEAAQAVREAHGEWRWQEGVQEVGSSGGEAQIGAQTGAQGSEAEAAAGTAAGTAAQGQANGSSPESPVSACGPQASYDYVARVFQCPGGGNPLGGDPRAGAASRVGNVGANSTGHVIDLYRVPCPEGPVEIYVDMYGCPEWEQRLSP